MLRLSSSLTSLLILLGLLLPQISATLSSMPLPDGLTSGGQVLDHRAQSPAEPQAGSPAEAQAEPRSAEPGSAEQIDHQSGAQLEPRQGARSVQCEVFPLNDYYRVIIDFSNWDPAKDGKPEKLEKSLQDKCGKDNFNHFWWRTYPGAKETRDTRFMINIPYPARDHMKGDMYQLISDAVYDYSKIRSPCYMF